MPDSVFRRQRMEWVDQSTSGREMITEILHTLFNVKVGKMKTVKLGEWSWNQGHIQKQTNLYFTFSLWWSKWVLLAYNVGRWRKYKWILCRLYWASGFILPHDSHGCCFCFVMDGFNTHYDVWPSFIVKGTVFVSRLQKSIWQEQVEKCMKIVQESQKCWNMAVENKTLSLYCAMFQVKLPPGACCDWKHIIESHNLMVPLSSRVINGDSYIIHKSHKLCNLLLISNFKKKRQISKLPCNFMMKL